MTNWFSPLFFLLAKCTENELRRHIEFLKAENEMVRSRVPKKKMGRPVTLEKFREIAIRLARENRWGIGRILGEFKKLRICNISETTIRDILKEEGLPPNPKRGNGKRDEFFKAHLDSLW